MALHDLKNIPEQEVFPGFRGKMIHTDKSTLAYWHIDKDCILPLHSHFHEQIVNVLDGELEMTIGDETIVLGKGQCYVIPSNVPHEGKAVSDCYVLDVFTPVREDYRTPSSN